MTYLCQACRQRYAVKRVLIRGKNYHRCQTCIDARKNSESKREQQTK
jgi:hypothetical protein